VITTQRSDSVILSQKLTHTALSKEKLSGLSIDLSEKATYSEEWVKGDELTITLFGEKPTDRLLAGKKEQIICLLSGQISIEQKDTTGKYYSGDFIILPKGCTGQWKSQGHGMIKYLVIEATDV